MRLIILNIMLGMLALLSFHLFHQTKICLKMSLMSRPCFLKKKRPFSTCMILRCHKNMKNKHKKANTYKNKSKQKNITNEKHLHLLKWGSW